MPSLNSIRILGHLGQDPTAKEVASGTVVGNFSVAVSSGTKEKPKTTWFRCVVWGTQATDLALNGKKGDIADVTGRMEMRKWEEKEVWELIVASMHVTPKKGKGEWVEE